MTLNDSASRLALRGSDCILAVTVAPWPRAVWSCCLNRSCPKRAHMKGLSIVGVRGRPTKWDSWYSSRRWGRIRRHQLLTHPLCKNCLGACILAQPRASRLPGITLQPHVPPYAYKFWLGPLQSLCKRCHDSTKRLVETRGFRPDVGINGWPIDPKSSGQSGAVRPLSLPIVAAAPGLVADIVLNNDDLQKPTVRLRSGQPSRSATFGLKAHPDHAAITGEIAAPWRHSGAIIVEALTPTSSIRR